MSEPADDAAAAPPAYHSLVDHWRRTSLLGSVQGVLGWDQECMLPPGGAAHRAEQQALITEWVHRERTDPRLGEWLDACEQGGVLDDPESPAAVNVREIRRLHERQRRVPGELAVELARRSTAAYESWKRARARDDFRLFRDDLAELIRCVRSLADHVGWEEERYDALLVEYEPGTTTRQVRALFEPLGRRLSELVRRRPSGPPPRPPITGPLDLERQRALCREVAGAFGFDFQRGRIDATVHPFCLGVGPDDVRLTTLFREDVLASVTGITHETGHGLYEQGLLREHWGTPMGTAVSLGIHESQSRLYENRVGRGRGFCRFLVHRLDEVLPGHGVDAEGLFDFLNAPRSGPIRVEADELGYDLHIILRFELEVALLEGELAVDDLPDAWNARAAELLDVEVESDAEGCLQDVHWSHAAFGYFPTYTLGNCHAAQLHAAFVEAHGDPEPEHARGEFGALLRFLRERIHRHGSRHAPNALCERATGAPLDPEPLLRLLEASLDRRA